jgi:hypothetical protein
MPKAPCPACKTEVKYPRDAEPGTELTCPECDEVFVPPELKVKSRVKAQKAYDVEEEETYRAERPVDDPDREAKSRRVAAVAYHGARQERERNRPKRRGWFDGPEIWLAIFAAGAGGGLPFGIWLSRNWEQMGAAKVFWLMVGLCFIAVVALSLGMSTWAWLRKNK